MISRPKPLKPAKENLILQKEAILDEIIDLKAKLEKETDPDEKAKLAEQVEIKECELGSIIHQSRRL